MQGKLPVPPSRPSSQIFHYWAAVCSILFILLLLQHPVIPYACMLYEVKQGACKIWFLKWSTVYKHKGKVAPVDVWRSGCIDPHFLDLGASWRWVVSLTPWSLYSQGKRSRCPLNRGLRGPHSRGEEKILDPTGTRTRPARSQSLYRLSYRGSTV
jgi:hypothetical protein